MSGGTLELNGNSISLANLSGTGGTIQETANSTVTLIAGSDNTSTTFGGTLADANGNRRLNFTKIGTGTLTFSGTNTYANGGVTTVNGGVLKLNNASALSSDNLTLNGGVLGLGVADFTRASGGNANQVQFTGNGGFAAYTADRNVNLGGASALVTWNSGSFVPTGSALILGANDADKTVNLQNPIDFNLTNRTVQVDKGSAAIDAILSGQLRGTGAGALVKAGAGTLSLTASNTYSGGTTINGGRLLVNNLTGSGTGSGSVIVNSGGTLGGTGFITGTITMNSGSTISVGNSPGPGKLNTGSQTWNSGATNLFEIRQAGGTEGADWDLLNITGGLTINATAGNKFVIDIRSLTLADTAGLVSDFNSNLSYDWRIAKTTAGITGFDATVFKLLLAGFSNGLGGGTFSMVANGNDLLLRFTAVPEASPFLLMGCGLLILGWTWRRHSV